MSANTLERPRMPDRCRMIEAASGLRRLRPDTCFARRCLRDGIPALTRDFLAFPLAGREFSPQNPPNF